MRRLARKNPMNRALIAQLVCDIIVFGLAIPGAILVDGHSPALAAGVCGAAMALALAALLGFRRDWGWWLAWATQIAGVALGALTSMMFVLGGIFLLLWIAMIVLGRRIEAANPGTFDA